MTTPYRDVAHLLRRAGFGGFPNEISALAALDLPDIVDTLLDPSRVPPVNAPSTIVDLNVDGVQRYYQFLWFWYDRMATTPSPLFEKMTGFWHSHFTSSGRVTDIANMWDQVQVFRTLGMGNFGTLAKATAITPAMLAWLNGQSNIVGTPNENFARESMELFTVGVNQYSQNDVVAAARAWTGHGVTSDSRGYVFRSNRHDNGSKTFLGITRNWDGPDTLDELCMGSGQAATARHVADKLWTWFAYANPEQAVSDALTNAFISSGMTVSSVLRAMFLRPEFYSDASRHGHVRSPFEHFVAMMRYSAVDATTAHPESYVPAAGQQLLYPPNVAGWGTNAYWVTTDNMWGRSNAARHIMYSAKANGILAGTTSVSYQTAAQRAFDAYGIDEPSPMTRIAFENAVYAERLDPHGREQEVLIQLAMLCPEFQTG